MFFLGGESDKMVSVNLSLFIITLWGPIGNMVSS